MASLSLFAPSRANSNKRARVKDGATFPHASAEEDAYHSSGPAATILSQLQLSPWLVSACAAMGIRRPTPVQAGCIPAVLAGRDLVACAPTGSGKTAAFALPLLHRLAQDPYGIFAVVLTPSRELALQITEQFAALGAPSGVRVCTVVGGLDLVKQATALADLPHIVVATPGRLAHLIKLGSSLSGGVLSRAGVLVLDEADRLLDDSMAPDLAVIFSAMARPAGGGGPGRLQTLLFSATLDMAAVAAAAEGAKRGEAGSGGARDVVAAAPQSALPSAAGFLQRLGLRDPFLFSQPRAGPAWEAGRAPSASSASSSSAPMSALPEIPASLRQEYLFVPDAVKSCYLYALLRVCMGEDLVVVQSRRRDAAPASSSSSSRPSGPGRAQGRGGRQGGGSGPSQQRKAPSLLQGTSQRAALKDKLRLRSSGGAAGEEDDAYNATAVAAAYREAVERATTGRGALGAKGIAFLSAGSSGVGRRGGRNTRRPLDDDDDDEAESGEGGADAGRGGDDDDEGGGRGDDGSGSDDDDADADDGDADGHSDNEHDGDRNGDDEEDASDEDDNDDDEDDDDEDDDDGVDEEGSTQPPSSRETRETLPPARSAIVFVSTVRSAQLTAETLIELGIPCAALHSGMKQPARIASLAKFRSSLVRVLVATDVASRGLDIPCVDLVVNADVPPLPSDYVHRVGRTARAGRGGRAVTIVTQYDVALLQAVEGRVLGGRALPAFSPPFAEAAVLASLGKVATAGKLAAARLVASGFEDQMQLRAERKVAAALERAGAAPAR